MRALHDSRTAEVAYRRVRVGSLRSRGSAEVRLPRRLMGAEASRGLVTLAGKWAYRGSQRVHRFDLRLPPASVPEVVTVHDLPPLRFPDEGALPSWCRVTASMAKAVICPSEFAAREVRELLAPQEVVVIPNGVRAAIKAPPMSAKELAALGVQSSRYVLHAAGASERKNLPALAAAWKHVSQAHDDVDLVLAGPPDLRRTSLFSVLPRARLVGFHDRTSMDRLLTGAACVVVPSVYEGFGLPALEAMSAGVPVVAARRGALPEVCGSAALLCEPEAAALGTALDEVLSTPTLARRLGEAGRVRAAYFTWERAAQRHREVYDEFLS